MNSRDLLSTAGISLAVSSFVVFVNNYFLYRHCCTASSNKQVVEPLSTERTVEKSLK